MGACPSFLMVHWTEKNGFHFWILFFFLLKWTDYNGAGQSSSHCCTADSSCLKCPPLWLMQPIVRSMLKHYIVLHYQDSSARKNIQQKKINKEIKGAFLHAPFRKWYANIHSWNLCGKVKVKSATHKQKYHLDMLADTGGEQKRTAVISGRALTDAINEDSKRDEGDLSGGYGDIPGKTGWLFRNKKGGKLQRRVWGGTATLIKYRPLCF